MPSDSTRTVLVALGAGLGVALAKVGAAVFTGSAALAAEAAHSLADSGNDLSLFVAQRRSSRPHDDQHPLGYGRDAYFWALIAALGVFVVRSAAYHERLGQLGMGARARQILGQQRARCPRHRRSHVCPASHGHTRSFRGKVAAKPLRIRLAPLGSHELRVRRGRIQLVVGITGEHVHVVVPDVLAARALVVLPHGDSLAPIGEAHRDRDLLDQVMHRMPGLGWQLVQVLVVPDRHDQQVPVIVRPPAR
jgi:hypothetical protein